MRLTPDSIRGYSSWFPSGTSVMVFVLMPLSKPVTQPNSPRRDGFSLCQPLHIILPVDDVEMGLSVIFQKSY